jgi:hypothetical protein
MRAVFGHAIKRSRKTANEPIGVGFKAPDELTLPISSKPDPRLVALVRILAASRARLLFTPHGPAGKARPPSRCSTPRMIGLRVNDP